MHLIDVRRLNASLTRDPCGCWYFQQYFQFPPTIPPSPPFFLPLHSSIRLSGLKTPSPIKRKQKNCSRATRASTTASALKYLCDIDAVSTTTALPLVDTKQPFFVGLLLYGYIFLYGYVIFLETGQLIWFIPVPNHIRKFQSFRMAQRNMVVHFTWCRFTGRCS